MEWPGNTQFFKNAHDTTMKVAKAHIPRSEIKPHTVAKIDLQFTVRVPEIRGFFNWRVCERMLQ